VAMQAKDMDDRP